MTSNDDVSERLRVWLGEQLPEATDVRVEGLDKVEFGHSAEILLLTVVWTADGSEHREDVVLRMRPPKPGLIEPYDMQRQFDDPPRARRHRGALAEGAVDRAHRRGPGPRVLHHGAPRR